jgi:hypothetical protein
MAQSSTNYGSNKGGAKIIRQGHTSLGRYGDEYNVPTRNSSPKEVRP